ATGDGGANGAWRGEPAVARSTAERKLDPCDGWGSARTPVRFCRTEVVDRYKPEGHSEASGNKDRFEGAGLHLGDFSFDGVSVWFGSGASGFEDRSEREPQGRRPKCNRRSQQAAARGSCNRRDRARAGCPDQRGTVDKELRAVAGGGPRIQAGSSGIDE